MLMTDIVGSTAMASRLGDAAWKQRLADHNRAVRRQLENFKGREINTTGDGFLAVFDSEVNYLDTGNNYGKDGLSERRIGEAIRRRGGLPEGFVLQTKVDADPETGDYSGDRVRRSLEESLERLGVDHLPILALHDPEFMKQDGFAPGGALEALVEIRKSGIADHLAVASGDVALSQRYLDTGEFDLVLNHNRYTLLNREAEELFTKARAVGKSLSR